MGIYILELFNKNLMHLCLAESSEQAERLGHKLGLTDFEVVLLDDRSFITRAMPLYNIGPLIYD